MNGEKCAFPDCDCDMNKPFPQCCEACDVCGQVNCEEYHCPHCMYPDDPEFPECTCLDA